MQKSVVQSVCVGIGIGLLASPRAFADPVTVTSGHVGAMVNGGTFTIRGDGFALSASPQGGGYESGLWDCTPCRAGDRLNLSLSSIAEGSFAGDGLPGDFNHVHYDHTWLTGILKFTAGDVSSAVLDEGQTSLSVPFTFFGELANFDSYASLVAALNGSGGVPLFVGDFTGSGIATAHFRGPIADPDGALFFADHIDYDFTPPTSPTPEPASLLLFSTGAAGLFARRRIRRSLEG